MRAHRIVAAALAAATAPLALAACSSPASSNHDQRSFSLGGHALIIDDTSSDLQVIPGTGPGIEVQRWLGGTAAKPGHSSWALRGNTLNLGIDCPGVVFSCESRFEVAVPSGMAVTVNSGAGTDTISGLSSAVTVHGNTGEVRASDISGPLRISTGAGSIAATGLRSSTAEVTANQGTADVSFAAPPRSVTVTCSSGTATVRLPADGHRYHVLARTGTGTASSTVPDDPGADSVVRVSSDNGDATVLPA